MARARLRFRGVPEPILRGTNSEPSDGLRAALGDNYALRVLMFNAAGDRLVTIEEMANAYDISRAHLMKVVNALTSHGHYHVNRKIAGK